MTDADKDFLKKLLSTPGPSSFESKPARVWRDQAEQYGANLRSDAYGNSFATFGGKKPRVMLAGHIDEIGLIITYIDDKGLFVLQRHRRLGRAATRRPAGENSRLQKTNF